MKAVLVLGLSLCIGEATAADPVNTPPAPATTMRKPLDLRVGNVRNYMMPNEYRAAVMAPDPDRSTVVVEGKRELLPMKSMTSVPGGILAPFWALANPLQGWRIFVPDPNAPALGPTVDKVPPPEFRWGP